jgi:hypothetical protein
MLLATWQTSAAPMKILKLRFSGLVWTAREIQRQNPGNPFLLISPWRTNAWNVLPVDQSPAVESRLQVIEGAPENQNNLPIYVLGERQRAIPPVGSKNISLPAFATLAHHLDQIGFLTQTEKVEPLQSGTTEYKKWTPTIPPA